MKFDYEDAMKAIRKVREMLPSSSQKKINKITSELNKTSRELEKLGDVSPSSMEALEELNKKIKIAFLQAANFDPKVAEIETEGAFLSAGYRTMPAIQQKKALNSWQGRNEAGGFTKFTSKPDGGAKEIVDQAYGAEITGMAMLKYFGQDRKKFQAFKENFRRWTGRLPSPHEIMQCGEIVKNGGRWQEHFPKATPGQRTQLGSGFVSSVPLPEELRPRDTGYDPEKHGSIFTTPEHAKEYMKKAAEKYLAEAESYIKELKKKFRELAKTTDGFSQPKVKKQAPVNLPAPEAPKITKPRATKPNAGIPVSQEELEAWRKRMGM